MTADITPYQSQYVAWLLSRRMNADSVDMLASTLVDAQVDLNPHQVDAALFAFQSPLSKGVIPVADPFIIACAKICKGTVVTEERLKPNAAKIPNVCQHHSVSVPCIDLETFMQKQGWSF